MPAACRNGRQALLLIGFALLLAPRRFRIDQAHRVMRGMIPDPHAAQVHALEAEVEISSRPWKNPEHERPPRGPRWNVSHQNMAPIMFAALVLFLLLGYPAAFSLGAVGLFFG